MVRRRRQQRDWDKVRGLVFAVIGVLLIAGLAGGWYWVSNKQVRLDVNTNCPVNGPTAVHAILIDRTDPIDPVQVKQVRQAIERYVRNSRIGERFDLYTINGDAVTALLAQASVCNPGRGDQANELYQNP